MYPTLTLHFSITKKKLPSFAWASRSSSSCFSSFSKSMVGIYIFAHFYKTNQMIYKSEDRRFDDGWMPYWSPVMILIALTCTLQSRWVSCDFVLIFSIQKNEKNRFRKTMRPVLHSYKSWNFTLSLSRFKWICLSFERRTPFFYIPPQSVSKSEWSLP